MAAGLVLAMAFTFSCSSDDGGGDGGSVAYEGQTYKTVKIGTQTWMAENLNYAVAGSKCYGEGGPVSEKDPEDEYGWIDKTLSAAEVQANCAKYGRLYDWSTAMALPSSCNESSCSSQIQPKHRGICPFGWHIPSDAEWTTLTDYVGGYEMAGTKLKATSGWNWNDYDNESGNGTDDFGFSALPGGSGYSGGGFDNVGDYGDWWSATESSAGSAYLRGMYYNISSVFRSYDILKSHLFSVRCIADESVAPSISSSSSSSGGQGGGSSSSVLSCGEYDPATQYCSNGTIKDYEFVPYEGQTYKAVVIGEQTWMAENLDYAVEGSKCYNNDPANCDKYGRLYSWVTAMELDINCDYNSCENQIQAQHRGICPSGWHIPSDGDWDVLIDYVGGYETAGTKLKATSGWNGGNGTDEYGFSALPGGFGSSGGSFHDVGNCGYWWSATESGASGAYYRSMYYYGSGVIRVSIGKSGLFSVRCLQD